MCLILLYPKDPDKAFQLTAKTIERADDFYYLNVDSYDNAKQDKVNLIDIMLDTIIKKDRALAIKLINKNIKEINVHEFPTFADKALQLRDTSLITSVFTRLETEDNPYVYLKGAEVLIAFHDANINKRLIDVSKRNPNLHKDWGGQEFAKLLEENHIK